ncbi:MAG: hypothetical protein MEQ07_02850 [Aquimonas sp.]|nr:hypothetical protein [Aquimonas sp.]
MNIRLPLTATALLIALTHALPAAAQADPRNGVQCPNGYTPTLAANNTHLTCHRESTVERASVCSPVTVSGRSGQIGANINLRREIVRNGADQCTDPTGRTNGGPPQAVLLPTDPTTGWTRSERANGEDIYVRAGQREYAFPRGASFNPTHNAANGVRCPGGYTGRANGGGMVCEQVTETRRANCDFGWSISVDHNRGRQDRCLGLNVGNTVPNGITNVQLQAQRAYWTLDARTGLDQWERRDYRYVSR